MQILAQVPILAAGDLEHWLIPAAAVLWLVGQWKKVFPKKDESFATQKELTALADKIDARFLALSEKIDALAARVSELPRPVAATSPGPERWPRTRT